MKQLVATTLPNRKGRWLALVDGEVCHVLAKFRNQDAAEEFHNWCAEADGKRFDYIDERAERRGNVR